MKRNFNCAEVLNPRSGVVALCLCILIIAADDCCVRGADYWGYGISYLNDMRQEEEDGGGKRPRHMCAEAERPRPAVHAHPPQQNRGGKEEAGDQPPSAFIERRND